MCLVDLWDGLHVHFTGLWYLFNHRNWVSSRLGDRWVSLRQLSTSSRVLGLQGFNNLFDYCFDYCFVDLLWQQLSSSGTCGIGIALTGWWWPIRRFRRVSTSPLSSKPKTFNFLLSIGSLWLLIFVGVLFILAEMRLGAGEDAMFAQCYD